MENLKSATEPDIFLHYQKMFRDKVYCAGAKHEIIRFILDLQENARPNPRKLVIAEGIWALKRALQEKLYIETFVFCPLLCKSTEAHAVISATIEQAEKSYLVGEKVFSKIAERENPDGLLALCRLPQWTLEHIVPQTENATLVVLDGIEIPGNIGTIIRSCEGAGALGVVLCNRRARLTHPKVIKGSQGSIFSYPVVDADFETLISWLQKHNFRLLFTDTDATCHYWEYSYAGRVAIVAGSERYGIHKNWYNFPHDTVKIPMYGSCDSLNVGVATSIFVYEACLQQRGMLNRKV